MPSAHSFSKEKWKPKKKLFIEPDAKGGKYASARQGTQPHPLHVATHLAPTREPLRRMCPRGTHQPPPLPPPLKFQRAPSIPTPTTAPHPNSKFQLSSSEHPLQQGEHRAGRAKTKPPEEASKPRAIPPKRSRTSSPSSSFASSARTLLLYIPRRGCPGSVRARKRRPDWRFFAF